MFYGNNNKEKQKNIVSRVFFTEKKHNCVVLLILTSRIQNTFATSRIYQLLAMSMKVQEDLASLKIYQIIM